MAMKAKNKKVGNEFGCGFVGRILYLKSHRLKNSTVHSLPIKPSNNDHVGKNEPKMSPNKEPKVPRKSTNNTSSLTEPHKLSVDHQKHARKSTFIYQANRRHSDAAARTSTSSSSTGISSSSIHTKVQQNCDTNDDVKLHRETTRNSLELARISTAHKQDNESNNKSPTLKLTGNLLVNNTPRRKSVECLPKNSEFNSLTSSYNSSNNGRKVVMGNIMRKNSNELAQFLSPRHMEVSLTHDVSSILKVYKLEHSKLRSHKSGYSGGDLGEGGGREGTEEERTMGVAIEEKRERERDEKGEIDRTRNGRSCSGGFELNQREKERR